ncbi:MAG: hypothetical protein H7Z21_13830, partial [Hymenobacter sp.]|nr:hypothetical protein [Hymenobacter sp.]
MTKARLADVQYEEIDLPEISVRGGELHSVYGPEEAVLFDADKAEIKPTATHASQEAAGVGKKEETGARGGAAGPGDGGARV